MRAPLGERKRVQTQTCTDIKNNVLRETIRPGQLLWFDLVERYSKPFAWRGRGTRNPQLAA
jgi:hypothetical protein